MAKYEKLGFCPESEIVNQGVRELKEHKNADTVRECLGNLPMYMVYRNNAFNEKGCYITEVLLTTEFIGLKLAEALKHLVISCDYPETEIIVWITDCINPRQVEGQVTFSDDKFSVGLLTCGEVAAINIYKK